MTKKFTAEGMQAALTALTEVWPKMFICLLVAPHEPGIANYISNGAREDVIKALRETADRLEKNQDNSNKG